KDWQLKGSFMRILVIDDEKIQRETLAAILSDSGYVVTTAMNVADAEAHVSAEIYDVVLSDFRMPDGTGLQVAEKVRGRLPEAAVFLMTAYADVNSVIESLRLGVVDYILKPINVESLLAKLQRLSEHREMRSELQDLRIKIAQREGGSLLGASAEIENLRQMIDRIALTKGTVLISGESGTGKEVAARLIHQRSSDAAKKFQAINCAAIPENLLESELFGHKKGAFTGAVSDRDGLFKLANGGTLFLDEIGDMPKALQSKLLRVLQEREVTPVGDTKSIKIDIRLIAASNRDLAIEVANGNFRQDLYYRINVVQIHMPPLREHPDDIPILAGHFVDKYVKEFHKKPLRISNEVMRALMDYQWPGNVRELENAIERAVILGPGEGPIELEHLPANFQALRPMRKGLDSAQELDVAISSFSRRHILKVLETTLGDKKEAAKILGLSLSSLYRKMDDFAIPKKTTTESGR
ncbi:MAG: sigma-54 dependent transcriptional regulator, partial [Proteobacteria bacterium]|nr:sigma-54 dependent transcriptional regulator [Pseudomonadota bacterium]